MNYAKDITSDYTASYAKYVATSRSVPSLVDGLKPVARRCINSADDLKLYHDKKFLKVAKLEGQVMGDYHPHGGASMTILAQPFKTRYPLFEGQGNFGSPDQPNSVAASRYIETRLTKFCEDFYLSSAEYADREDNYDGRLKEVVRYYPPIPGVLLTGASGIAVGLSTNIPTHRISDVCASFLEYLNKRDSGNYLDTILPETCEESIILTSRSEIRKMYEKGEGSIQYKAKTHYESIDGKLALVVDAFPPDYSKKRLETSFILEAVESGELELRNESSTGIRYVFLANNKDILEAVEERLISSTGYRFYIEHEGKIHQYTLSELYEDFIAARQVYIIRKYSDLIRKNLKDIEFIRVLLLFKEDREYVKSVFDKSPKEVVEEIVIKFDTNAETASRVISTSISSMMKDNAEKLKKRYEELESQNKEYREYVDNPLSRMIEEVRELYNEYKDEEKRALHIDDVSDKIDIEYRGIVLTDSPSSLYYLASHDNTYELVHMADLLEKENLDDYIVVNAKHRYYVFYDEQGLIAVDDQTMKSMSSKFKSSKLGGIIGTDDLGSVMMKRSNSKKDIPLGDWALRTRLSYIRQVEEGDYIKLWVNIAI